MPERWRPQRRIPGHRGYPPGHRPGNSCSTLCSGLTCGGRGNRSRDRGASALGGLALRRHSRGLARRRAFLSRWVCPGLCRLGDVRDRCLGGRCLCLGGGTCGGLGLARVCEGEVREVLLRRSHPECELLLGLAARRRGGAAALLVVLLGTRGARGQLPL